MESETRNCQNCKKDFIIDPEDFNFYEKIKVPPPTFCPECRLERRLSFRNERSLHRVVCNLCKKNTLSVIPQGKLKVYCVACWVSEKWDPMDYASGYNFSKNFFEQYKELIWKMPNRALASSSTSLINSEYSNTSSNLKDCYLIYGSDGCENCMYSSEVFDSFDCLDCKMITSGTACYSSVNCQRCSRVNYSVDCRDSLDLDFCRNLSNCSNCFICANLNNKSYHIFNEPYSKEEYLLKINGFKNGYHSKIMENKEIAKEFINKFPVKFYHGFKNNKFSGDYVYNSKNTINSFFTTGAEDCKYCFNLVMNFSKGCFDYSDWGANTENIYESLSCGNNVSNLKFCLFVGKHSMDMEYSAHCANCQNVFGCLGLRNKKYCILNKQYTKEEYFKMVKEIKKHMDEMPYVDKNNCVYKYGEFLPAEISIFPYNDSTAFDYFPLTKKEIEERGFTYIEKINKNYKVDMKAIGLIDKIEDVGEDILEKVIECKNKENKLSYNCIGAFRILERELSFYKKENIPLPRFCPNCRHEERSKYVNPPKLWYRTCMKEGCQNEFETSYAPERPEIVYCEKCYQQEVY